MAGAVGNILHPTGPDAQAEAAQTIANIWLWVPVHVSIAISIFLIDGARSSLRVLKGGRPEAWARYGYFAAIVGLTIGITQMASDGITAKYASVAWAHSSELEKLAALQVAAMAERCGEVPARAVRIQ